MAVKEDKAQVSLLLDAEQPINQLGKLEMKLRESKREMKLLEKASKEYTKTEDKMIALAHAGKQQSKAYQNAAQKLANLKDNHNAFMLKKNEYEQVSVKVNAMRKAMGLAAMTMRQKMAYARQLKNEINNLSRRTTTYKQTLQELQRVNKSISSQRNEIKGTTSAWSRLSGEIKQFGKIALVALIIQQITQRIQELVSRLAKLSDRLADVRKTTGLTQKQVEELNKSLSKINTRTSRKELLALAQIAGKLGVTGKRNIEGFVKAADKLVVALGEDLGGNAEQTIRQVGKLVDVFKVKEQFGLEEGLLKVGSTINALGAASTANEAFLVDFTKRLGGIAPNANISIDKVLGLAATLDQLGQTSEASSTAMAQLLVALGQDMPAFAKIAGMEVNQFAKLLEDDANAALIKVIAGAKSSKEGLSGMAETLNRLEIDGARAAAVVGVLSNNIELLEKQQSLAKEEFDKGTSILTEFAVKNETLGAKLEKIQKKLAGIFVNSTLMNGAKWMIDSLDKLLTKNEDLEKALDRETIAMHALFDIIRDTNTSTHARKEAIKKLNEEYGNYLPQAIKEKDTLEAIEKAQQAATKALVQHMVLKSEQEKIEQYIRESIENQQEAISNLQQVTGELITYQNRRVALQKSYNEAIKEGDKISSQKLENDLNGTDLHIEKLKKQIELYNQAADAIAAHAGLDLIKKQTDELLAAFGIGRSTTTKANKEAEGEKGGSGGGNTTSLDTDERARLLEQWRVFNRKVTRMAQVRDGQLRAIDMAEMERIDNKYESLIKQLDTFKSAHIITEKTYNDRIKQLRKAHDEDMDQLAIKRGEQAAKKRTKELEQALADWQLFYKKIQDLADIREGKITESLITERDSINEKYKDLHKQLETFHEKQIISEQEFKTAQQNLHQAQATELINFEKKKNEELAKLREKDAKDQQAKMKENRQQWVTFFQGISGLTAEFASLSSALNDLVASQGEQMANFQKELAVFTVAMESASAIAAAVAGAVKAAATTGPAAPFVMGGYITSMVATVISGMAKAKKLLNEKPPSAPENLKIADPLRRMAEGGYTGEGLNFKDETGHKPAGIVHDGEYVVPKWLLANNQWVADQVAMIEGLRMRKGFSQGGQVSQMPSAPSMPQGMDSALLSQIVSSLQQLNETVKNQQNTLKAVITYNQFEELKDYDQRVENAEKQASL